MAQNSQPLDLAEALQQLFIALPQAQQTEYVALTNALGRILAKAVHAEVDLPPFDASAMDGYAIRGEDLNPQQNTTFKVCGTSMAGHPSEHALQPGQAVRIFTGAKVPNGADQILLQEDALEASAEKVSFPAFQPSESYLRPRGHDLSKGSELASAHQHISAFTIGILATAGVAQVEVFTPLVIGVFSSGDELVDPGTPPQQLATHGQIYDSNRHTVLQLLADMPCTLIDMGRLPDEAAAVESALTEASDNCDVLITSGGVSVGDADYITATIARLGKLAFWRLNLKPGKPMAVGQIGNCHIFGLPGNPVSTIVTLLMVAKPAIWHLAGRNDNVPLRIQATLSNHLTHQPGRAEFQRGIYSYTDKALWVAATGDQSSNRMSTFRHANCLIEVAKEQGDLATGTPVTILPFNGLLS